MKYYLTLFFLCYSLTFFSQKQSNPKEYQKDFARCSTCTTNSTNFNSCQAINKIVDIENEHLIDFNTGTSNYYGTLWREYAESTLLETGITQYQSYLNEIDNKPDSLHCTIYAYEGLKAGLNEEQLDKLEKIHKKIWKTRERAGWSVGYILVKYFGWKAYLIIDPSSKEYDHCLRSYKKSKSYPVWKQPNILLEAFYVIGKHDASINELLAQQEFGWGFSEQGIHTWVTRYQELKECNWFGAPSIKYQQSPSNKPMFISTKFKDYVDYNSHVIVFPSD